MLNDNELIDKIRHYELAWLRNIDKKELSIKVRLELKDLLDRYMLAKMTKALTITQVIDILAVETPLEFQLTRKRRLFSNIFKTYQQKAYQGYEPYFRETNWLQQQKDLLP